MHRAFAEETAMRSEEGTKQELIARVAEQAGRRLEAAEALAFAEFARRYYDDADVDDLAGREVADLYGAAASHWRFLQSYAGGAPKLRVFSPNAHSHGWSSPHTVVEIVNDDMPFLVDSVTMEANRQGLAVHLMLHPVMRVKRGADGVFLGLAEGGDGCFESIIHAELDRRSDAAVLENLEAGFRRALADVRAAVEDWHAMLERIPAAIAEIDACPPPQDAAQTAEDRAFLEWFAAGNFTLLGYRRYDLVTQAGEDHLRVVPGTGQGILRESGGERISASFAQLPPASRAAARAPRLLIITKTNARSTVHRPGYLDYIGIRRFDRDGVVLGEHRFLGLFASSAYNQTPAQIPLLRRKIKRVSARAGLLPGSHAAKAFATILEQYPRDELFQIDEDELLANALGILRLGARQRLRLFVRRDAWGRFYSCLLYVPRERYNTEVRGRMQRVLAEALGGDAAEFSVQVSESMLARILVTVRTAPGSAPVWDLRAIEAKLGETIQRWEDSLREALIERLGEERAGALFTRYGAAFPAAYREDTAPRAAVHDIELMEGLAASGEPALALYAPIDAAPDALRLKVLRRGTPIALSEGLPMLEHMGLRVIEERPYRIGVAGDEAVWIHDFGMTCAAELSLDRVRPLFQDALLRVWTGETDDDDFNRLILARGLSWREVAVLRSYAKYMRQAGSGFSQGYIERTLAVHSGLAAQLIELFRLRFDPAAARDAQAAARQDEAIEQSLAAVESLDEDRILRRFLALIRASVRTNYYQRGPGGAHKPWLSFKFDCARVPGLPEPRPLYEIYVCSPRVEGVHLRGGKVARGGLRWSDRMEDYRTEVLGLAKAQRVKNAVIVPVGSKGGFVLRRPPAGREALAAEAVPCYRTYLRGLLDLTDNLVGGKVVPPPDVVRYDEDDPYLVVAADKGTAAFSDYANEISREYGFWLGDAFASGGSAGFDHKKMAITARGAWESVRRHFRELGMDPDRDDFTVAGIGDMSGDVFGNGMLRSRHLRLVAAFDHRHVFLDPDPDPEASFAERERLFRLPRSSWADYDAKCISAGGGVWPRSAKSVPVSAPVRAVLGIADEALAPAELIRAILRAPVDLLYNGGIGTYVKSRAETHAEVGDRANDAVRVDGAELRARAVVEGGNLGFTQRARIEYAAAGGRINTDAIDNSAGVDCSDHEVNLKILLDAVVTQGELTLRQRDALLVEMTEEVAGLVLHDNIEQNRALQLACAQGAALLDAQARFIRHLEKSGRLDRALEFLPGDEELAARKAAGLGLTSPENAVLLAYAKLDLYEEVLSSDLPEDPAFAGALFAYFPEAVRTRFREAIARHPLKREIVATCVANGLVNLAGAVFVFRLREETGAQAADVVRAWALARDAFAVRALSEAAVSLDARVPVALRSELMITLLRLMGRGTRWFLRRPALVRDPSATLAEFAPRIARLAERLPELLGHEDRGALEAALAQSRTEGVPEPLALSSASFEALYAALDIAQLSIETGSDVERVAATYFSAAALLELRWVAAQIAALPGESQWQGLARSALRDEFASAAAALARAAAAHLAPAAPPEAALDAWRGRHAGALARYAQIVAELRQAGTVDMAMLSVLLRELRGLE
ncbi:MAG: NAD-glutamate dehydrogenase [Rhodocyclales bacterium CG_4_9_14_3_um_filter_68_10]|nr:MAG: NAD-glutamate dehydrogenase [Rhodocyclales bacterium CG_4_9_14_3_um_filter_68_10]